MLKKGYTFSVSEHVDDMKPGMRGHIILRGKRSWVTAINHQFIYTLESMSKAHLLKLSAVTDQDVYIILNHLIHSAHYPNKLSPCSVTNVKNDNSCVNL